MENKNSNGSLFLVVLPPEPKLGKKLTAVNELILAQGGLDVIIDFSQVEMITSSNIANLMILRDQLSLTGNKLTFCNVAFATKCILKVSGIDGFFHFVDDKPAALKFYLESKKE